MPYDLPDWVNDPSTASPLNETNLEKINTAINGLDTRTLLLEGALNTQTGTTYTTVLADAGKTVERSNAAANTITIPPNSSVNYPIGTVILIRQMGAGTTTVAPGSGVTIRSRGSLLALAGQYAEAVISKRATDEWVLSGDLT